MYRALTSFSGINISMAKGQVREINEPDIAQDLLQAGYIEEVKDEIKEIKKEVEEEKKIETKKSNKKSTKK